MNDDTKNDPSLELDATKRYVRTFASDQAAISRGEHPELIPLTRSGEESVTVVHGQPSVKAAPKPAAPHTHPAPAPTKTEPASMRPPIVVKASIPASALKKPAPLPPAPKPITPPAPAPKPVAPPAASKPVSPPVPAAKPEPPAPPPAPRDVQPIQVMVSVEPDQEEPKKVEVPATTAPKEESREEILARLMAKVAPPAPPVMSSADHDALVHTQEEVGQILKILKENAEAEAKRAASVPPPAPAPKPVAPPAASKPLTPPPTPASLPAKPALPPVMTTAEEDAALSELRARRAAERERVARELSTQKEPPTPVTPTPAAPPVSMKPPAPVIVPPLAPKPVPPPAAPAPKPAPEQTSLPPLTWKPPVTTEERPALSHTYTSDAPTRPQEIPAPIAKTFATNQSAAPRRAATAAALTELPWRRIALIAGIVVLFAGGAAGIYVTYSFLASHPATVAPAPTVTAPIFVDDREQVSGTGDTLLAAIATSAGTPLSANMVRLLYSTTGTTTTTDLFSALKLPVPGAVSRNIVSEKSIAGIANTGSTQYPFFILSVSSYGDTFAGMLSWEPRMVQDLSVLFPPTSTPGTDQTSLGFSTSTTKTTAPAKVSIVGFYDEVVANHDIRAYHDQTGQTVLVYGYWNASTLIIARDQAAFAELVNRLSGVNAL